MTRLLPLALAILLVNIPATTCRAQLDPETVQRIKRATALVEVSSDKVGATGSGFCVDQSGLFITNAARRSSPGPGKTCDPSCTRHRPGYPAHTRGHAASP